MDKPRIGIGNLVLKDGKILLGKRKNSHGDGTWGAPGGHLEFNETVVNCTCRELFEETNLKALEVHEGPWVEFFLPKERQHYVTIFTFVTKFSGELINKEPEKKESWDWFPWEDLPSPLFEPLQKIQIQNSIEPYLRKHLDAILKIPQMV